AGSSYTFYVSSGTYDLKAEDCSNNVLDEQYGIQTSASSTWTVYGGATNSGPSTSGDGSVSVTMTNYTPNTACYVYISPSTSDSWGSDWLGSSTVASQGSYTFWVTPGTYDLKAEDCSGNVLDELYGISIYNSYSWPLYWAEPGVGPQSSDGMATLQVVNHVSDICYLYIAPSSTSEWGTDWLGSGILPYSNWQEFVMEPDTYDIHADYCNGAEDYWYDIWVSGYTTYDLY
ncbi:MAG: hypothetical protein IT326_04730, partial [Anaerolineae bacterium]|nr:hypothetical protein [Anaerolineae bacterium]